MKSIWLFFFSFLFFLPAVSQRKQVETSGDVLVFATPVAGLATTLILKDYQGLKQAAFSGATALAVTYALKYIVRKERPDKSDKLSFPSSHTMVAFTGAAFIQRRYGWKYGIPAYLVSSYVAWSRVYADKHDWWDVAAGAAIGIGSAYLYTRPFARKHQLVFGPVVVKNRPGIYASLTF